MFTHSSTENGGREVSPDSDLHPGVFRVGGGEELSEGSFESFELSQEEYQSESATCTQNSESTSSDGYEMDEDPLYDGQSCGDSYSDGLDNGALDGDIASPRVEDLATGKEHMHGAEAFNVQQNEVIIEPSQDRASHLVTDLDDDEKLIESQREQGKNSDVHVGKSKSQPGDGQEPDIFALSSQSLPSQQENESTRVSLVASTEMIPPQSTFHSSNGSDRSSPIPQKDMPDSTSSGDKFSNLTATNSDSGSLSNGNTEQDTLESENLVSPAGTQDSKDMLLDSTTMASAAAKEHFPSIVNSSDVSDDMDTAHDGGRYEPSRNFRQKRPQRLNVLEGRRVSGGRQGLSMTLQVDSAVPSRATAPFLSNSKQTNSEFNADWKADRNFMHETEHLQQTWVDSAIPSQAGFLGGKVSPNFDPQATTAIHGHIGSDSDELERASEVKQNVNKVHRNGQSTSKIVGRAASFTEEFVSELDATMQTLIAQDQAYPGRDETIVHNNGYLHCLRRLSQFPVYLSLPSRLQEVDVLTLLSDQGDCFASISELAVDVLTGKLEPEVALAVFNTLCKSLCSRKRISRGLAEAGKAVELGLRKIAQTFTSPNLAASATLQTTPFPEALRCMCFALIRCLQQSLGQPARAKDTLDLILSQIHNCSSLEEKSMCYVIWSITEMFQSLKELKVKSKPKPGQVSELKGTVAAAQSMCIFCLFGLDISQPSQGALHPTLLKYVCETLADLLLFSAKLGLHSPIDKWSNALWLNLVADIANVGKRKVLAVYPEGALHNRADSPRPGYIIMALATWSISKGHQASCGRLILPLPSNILRAPRPNHDSKKSSLPGSRLSSSAAVHLAAEQLDAGAQAWAVVHGVGVLYPDKGLPSSGLVVTLAAEHQFQLQSLGLMYYSPSRPIGRNDKEKVQDEDRCMPAGTVVAAVQSMLPQTVNGCRCRSAPVAVGSDISSQIHSVCMILSKAVDDINLCVTSANSTSPISTPSVAWAMRQRLAAAMEDLQYLLAQQECVAEPLRLDFRCGVCSKESSSSAPSLASAILDKVSALQSWPLLPVVGVTFRMNGEDSLTSDIESEILSTALKSKWHMQRYHRMFPSNSTGEAPAAWCEVSSARASGIWKKAFEQCFDKPKSCTVFLFLNSLLTSDNSPISSRAGNAALPGTPVESLAGLRSIMQIGVDGSEDLSVSVPAFALVAGCKSHLQDGLLEASDSLKMDLAATDLGDEDLLCIGAILQCCKQVRFQESNVSYSEKQLFSTMAKSVIWFVVWCSMYEKSTDDSGNTRPIPPQSRAEAAAAWSTVLQQAFPYFRSGIAVAASQWVSAVLSTLGVHWAAQSLLDMLTQEGMREKEYPAQSNRETAVLIASLRDGTCFASSAVVMSHSADIGMALATNAAVVKSFEEFEVTGGEQAISKSTNGNAASKRKFSMRKLMYTAFSAQLWGYVANDTMRIAQFADSAVYAVKQVEASATVAHRLQTDRDSSLPQAAHFWIVQVASRSVIQGLQMLQGSASELIRAFDKQKGTEMRQQMTSVGAKKMRLKLCHKKEVFTASAHMSSIGSPQTVSSPRGQSVAGTRSLRTSSVRPSSASQRGNHARPSSAMERRYVQLRLERARVSGVPRPESAQFFPEGSRPSSGLGHRRPHSAHGSSRAKSITSIRSPASKQQTGTGKMTQSLLLETNNSRAPMQFERDRGVSQRATGDSHISRTQMQSIIADKSIGNADASTKVSARRRSEIKGLPKPMAATEDLYRRPMTAHGKRKYLGF